MKQCPECGDSLIVKSSQALVDGKVGYRCVACGWKKIIR